MPVARTPNRRGEGVLLRAEIIAAATRLLGQATSREAVTLRAIARETGIAAPSIYKQFADRDEILDAVVTRTFEELDAACRGACAPEVTGRRRIRAISLAYVAFGKAHPAEYRILFERSPANINAQPHEYPTGIALFQYFIEGFQQAVQEGTSTSPDPTRDAQALWAALHGLITVVPATPAFPWLPELELLDYLIEALSA